MPPRDPDLAAWFAAEVLPHETALRAYLRERFPSLLDLDDLVQDTYARLSKTWRAGGVTHPKAYLFATARNLALDLFRRRQVVAIDGSPSLETLPVFEDRPDAAEAASQAQELQLLDEALTALPARCREILVLRRLRGWSHAQIAEKLGISERTVNAQLAIGVLRCRAYLRVRGVWKESTR